ncbi:hypothetical protein [Acetobacter oeni]|uniref:Hydrolase n=1 Tax=Acetobacter oeni TaxID=304077 RepID=A0A511XMI6_9PROT|nr:hypothetical protein [Acetobacter oeni]MBB3882015.1 FMN phosphatase YigB (HAD superfamily) [Acetobacter oeni]NHO17668.1 hypothetical protein [Acetobacter oeni]GBR00267.1 hypothetical protein AA21952_0038 [Acetobacter oeni LMG 21952]GEN64162.1 hypothetical protein AOE01nite_23860 [Acetobacter oeni]
MISYEKIRRAILEEWIMNDDWLARFRSGLDGIDVVSMDVFDTALTRIVEAPVDVFAATEEILTQKYGSLFSGYAVRREVAEEKAREIAGRTNRSEVCFPEIISALILAHPDYKTFENHLIGTELAVEQAMCFAVPEIMEAVRICDERGIRVIFVSDMYLSGEEIRSLLTSAGYAGAYSLLVSSETDGTKANGRQWPVVRELCGSRVRILHVGDNEWSDVIMPRQAGLKALPFYRVRSDLRRGGPLTPAVLPVSCIRRAAMLREFSGTGSVHPASQMMSISGASWGTVVAGSFVRWLAQRAEKLGLKHLFFCARDSWLFYQLWQKLDLDTKTGIKSSYLHVSRCSVNYGAVAVTCRPDHLSDQALSLLGHVTHPETVWSLLKRSNLQELLPLVADLISLFGSLDADVSPGSGSAKFQNCLQSHSEIVYGHLRQILTATLCYFRQEGLHEGRAGIVDIGWHASMQAAAGDILRDGGHSPMLFGLYAGLRQGAQANRARAGWIEGAFSNDYMRAERLYGLSNAVAILENAFSSPEGVTLGYEWRTGAMWPVLGERSSPDSQYHDLIAPFQEMALYEIGHIFAGTHPSGLTEEDLTPEAGNAAIGRLALSPTPQELAVLGQLHHAPDLAHHHVAPMVPELEPDMAIGEHLNLEQCEWAVGSALAALRRCGDPIKREHMAHDFRKQCGYYDARTLRQFT